MVLTLNSRRAPRFTTGIGLPTGGATGDEYVDTGTNVLWKNVAGTWRQFGSGGGSATAGIVATVDRTASSGYSRTAPAYHHSDNALTNTSVGDTTARNNARALLASTFRYQLVEIKGFGQVTPWAAEATEPTNADWVNSGIDAAINTARSTGAEPVLVLYGAPFWMVGHRNTAGQGGGLGTYTMGTSEFQSSPVSWDDMRVRDDKMLKWVRLVELAATRYMAAPYNVRHFVVWNERKGYYNPATNLYDMSATAVAATAAVTSGYTDLYNRTYNQLRTTATAVGVAPSAVNVYGPYLVMDTWGTSEGSGNPVTTGPLAGDRGYGYFDQRNLDDLQYWLANKVGAQGMAMDMRNFNRPNAWADPYTDLTNGGGQANNGAFGGTQKFADIIAWLRSLDPATYPGANTLPVINAELYVGQQFNVAPGAINMALIAALWAAALIRVTKADQLRTTGAPNMQARWGNLGEEDRSQVWTSTLGVGGGVATAVLGAMKTFTDHFSPGTLLYPVTITGTNAANVEALASATKTLLVNKSNAPLTVNLTGTDLTLAAYEVRVI
jgi:hypothetical protein